MIGVASAVDRERSRARTALCDVREDCEELLAVARNGLVDLSSFADDLRARSQVPRGTVEVLLEQATALATRYREISTRLLGLACRAGASAGASLELGESEIDRLAGERGACAGQLRALQSVLAGLVVAPDWQSPSFLHSGDHGATGPRQNAIVPHWNDYKRDRHLDADAYERAYEAELPDRGEGHRAFLTACGMAAFTTILSVLRSEGTLVRVLSGRAVYHETLELLGREFGSRVELVDEGDTGALLEAVHRLDPTAIFLDVLCNSRLAPLPDLASLCAELHTRDRRVALVVDATGLAATGSVLALTAGHDAIRPFVFESLLKYAQHGFDRTNAGLLVVAEADAEAMSDAREHLGTNISDVAVRMLPPPNRRLLLKRLLRIERNATVIAELLEAELRTLPAGPIEAIAFPGLVTHSAYERATELPFRGGCVSIAFRTEVDPRWQTSLMRTAVGFARRSNVALAAGSSFGFDLTRIYVTAADAAMGTPFVRIAAGTEHVLAVERLAEVLAAAVRKVTGDYGSKR